VTPKNDGYTVGKKDDRMIREYYSLTLRWPWFWYVAEGEKTVENRSRPTSYRGPILIHAGKSIDPDALNWIARKGLPTNVPTPAKTDMGKIVAMAELADVVWHSNSPWKENGQWGYVLKNIKKLSTPIAIKGQQGLYRVQLESDLLRLS
jgi:hypothetical protein